MSKREGLIVDHDDVVICHCRTPCLPCAVCSLAGLAASCGSVGKVWHPKLSDDWKNMSRKWDAKERILSTFSSETSWQKATKSPPAPIILAAISRLKRECSARHTAGFRPPLLNNLPKTRDMAKSVQVAAKTWRFDPRTPGNSRTTGLRRQSGRLRLSPCIS